MLWRKQKRKSPFWLAVLGLTACHGREVMSAGKGNKRAEDNWGLSINVQVPPQWLFSHSNSPPHKCSTVFPTNIINCGPTVQTLEDRGNFTFKSKQWVNFCKVEVGQFLYGFIAKIKQKSQSCSWDPFKSTIKIVPKYLTILGIFAQWQVLNTLLDIVNRHNKHTLAPKIFFILRL